MVPAKTSEGNDATATLVSIVCIACSGRQANIDPRSGWMCSNFCPVMVPALSGPVHLTPEIRAELFRTAAGAEKTGDGA